METKRHDCDKQKANCMELFQLTLESYKSSNDMVIKHIIETQGYMRTDQKNFQNNILEVINSLNEAVSELKQVPKQLADEVKHNQKFRKEIRSAIDALRDDKK